MKNFYEPVCVRTYQQESLLKMKSLKKNDYYTKSNEDTEVGHIY